MRRFLSLLCLAAPVSVFAIWPMPESVPVERLLRNTKLAVAKHPKDAKLRYFNARVNSLAFALDAKTIDLYKDDKGSKAGYHFPTYANIQQARQKANKKLTSRELQFLLTSLNEYYEAQRLDPANPLAKVGFAWMHEEGAPYASQIGKLRWISASTLTPQAMRNKAAEIYRTVYRSQKAQELANVTMDLPSNKPGAEAGRSLLRLFEMGVKASPGEVAEIKATIKKIDGRPGFITPIIFPISGGADLFRPDAKVAFDLKGDGTKQRWSWVSRQAAFLAWDPKGTGRIASGQQLFGSRTFWMFFANGYDALASLDDNLDGWLKGKELQGIVVWHDANENGVSDPGEVASLENWGIVAIRTKLDAYSNGMPTASRGIIFSNGVAAPTIDWIAEGG